MKKLFVLLLVIAMIMTMVACNKEEATTEEGDTTVEATEVFEVAFVIPSTESQYWAQYLGTGVENGCLYIEETYGVDVNLTVYGPATEAETDIFLSTMESVIAKKPDAMIMATLQPDATAPLVADAAGMGIFVNLVSLGITGNEDAYGSFYYCDQVEQGAIAAQALVDQLNAKNIPLEGTVGVHMSVVVPVLEAKIQNFRDTMAELAPNIVLLETVYNENDVNNAQANVENQIATYGDELIGFFGANNVSGDGIALAVKNAGPDMSAKLCSVAVDSDELEIQALRDGELGAIVVQTPYEQGYRAAINVYEYVVNGISDPKEVNLSAQVVTKENMDEEEFAALLNPLMLKKED